MKGNAGVFISFATRSTSSLSSEDFLATFDWFVGKRSLPKRLMTDFAGTSKRTYQTDMPSTASSESLFLQVEYLHELHKRYKWL